jgi:hypothetical protein
LAKSTKHIPGWVRFLVEAAVFFGVVFLADFVLVFFFGSQFWFYGYIFGSDFRTTLGVLMFIEGAVLIALGVGVGVGTKTVFYGKYGKIYQYSGLDEQNQRGEKTENKDGIGLFLLFVGGAILIVSFISFFV